MAEGQEPVLSLHGVSKHYGKIAAVSDVSLAVAAGECIALLGHNGAGKTTLIKLMLGLTRPSAGEIRVLGEAPDSRRAVATRRAVGFLPENIAFHGAMSGRQTLAFYARLLGVPRARCEVLLGDVGLAEAAAAPLRTYSKGMRQRLGIAQALLGEPRLLLFDEPTTGLDPGLRKWFWELVDARRAAGVTVVISSHSLHEIEPHADRAAILHRGRLKICGSLAALRARAGLPTRLRVTVAAGCGEALVSRLEGSVAALRMDERSLDLTCINGETVALVGKIASLGEAVRGIEILPPGLEQLYAHFTATEDTP